MTIQERLADAHRRSVRLYLHRQQLQLRAQQTQHEIVQCEQALLKSDGEIEALQAVTDAELEASGGPLKAGLHGV